MIVGGRDRRASVVPPARTDVARATLGLARTGTWSGNGSGDIFVAFSTANRFERGDEGRERNIRWYDPARMDPLFLATVEAVEEAVLNAMTKAETMTGINNTTVEAIPSIGSGTR